MIVRIVTPLAVGTIVFLATQKKTSSRGEVQKINVHVGGGGGPF